MDEVSDSKAEEDAWGEDQDEQYPEADVKRDFIQLMEQFLAHVLHLPVLFEVGYLELLAS